MTSKRCAMGSAVLAMVLSACSSSSTPSPAGSGGNAGASAAGGASGGSGAPAGGAGGAGGSSAQCGTPVEVLADIAGAETLRLGLDGRIYFIDRKGGDNTGLFPSGAVKSVKTDGTDLQTVYTAPKLAQIFGLQIDANNVYFMQDGPGTGQLQVSYLSKVALGGGAVTKVSPASLGFDTISEITAFFAIDSGSAFVATLGSSTGSSITRVDLSSGVETVIAKSASGVNYPQILGDNVWVQPLMSQGGFVKVPKGATSDSQTPVGTKNCFPLGMTATQDGFLCGGSTSIPFIDVAATTTTTLMDLLKSDPGEVDPSVTDGSVVYVAAQASATTGRNLYKVTLGNPPVVSVAACDRRTIKNERQHIPSLALSSTDLFWIETRATVTSIFRMTR
jgi:hypothetical protein